MKFNWGWGILIVLMIFIAFMSNLVYKSSHVNVDLVSENYYEKEIKYQEQINREKNSLGLRENLIIDKSMGFIKITYPRGYSGREISGTIQFFKPDNASLDYTETASCNGNNEQIINTKTMKSGWWEIKINWSYQGTDYYKSEKILL